MEKDYTVKITYQELLLLDGRVSAETQAIIDEARKAVEMGFAFEPLWHIVIHALKVGKLSLTSTTTRHCEFCGKSYSYYPYRGSSRYHKKGQPNPDKPIYYPAVDFGNGTVICKECVTAHDAVNVLLQSIIIEDLPIEIPSQNGFKTKYRKISFCKCWKCGAEHSENLFINNTCPDCGTTSVFGNRHHKINRFEMISVEAKAA